jgi:hypothetical protein
MDQGLSPALRRVFYNTTRIGGSPSQEEAKDKVKEYSRQGVRGHKSNTIPTSPTFETSLSFDYNQFSKLAKKPSGTRGRTKEHVSIKKTEKYEKYKSPKGCLNPLPVSFDTLMLSIKPDYGEVAPPVSPPTIILANEDKKNMAVVKTTKQNPPAGIRKLVEIDLDTESIAGDDFM